MKKNHLIAGLAAAGMLLAAFLLYSQPETAVNEPDSTIATRGPSSVRGRHIREAQMAPSEVQQIRAPAQQQAPTIVPVPADLKLDPPFKRPMRSPLSVLETLVTIDGPQSGDGSK